MKLFPILIIVFILQSYHLTHREKIISQENLNPKEIGQRISCGKEIKRSSSPDIFLLYPYFVLSKHFSSSSCPIGFQSCRLSKNAYKLGLCSHFGHGWRCIVANAWQLLSEAFKIVSTGQNTE